MIVIMIKNQKVKNPRMKTKRKIKRNQRIIKTLHLVRMIAIMIKNLKKAKQREKMRRKRPQR